VEEGGDVECQGGSNRQVGYNSWDSVDNWAELMEPGRYFAYFVTPSI
jgi:hypothetical protein